MHKLQLYLARRISAIQYQDAPTPFQCSAFPYSKEQISQQGDFGRRVCIFYLELYTFIYKKPVHLKTPGVLTRTSVIIGRSECPDTRMRKIWKTFQSEKELYVGLNTVITIYYTFVDMEMAVSITRPLIHHPPKSPPSPQEHAASSPPASSTTSTVAVSTSAYPLTQSASDHPPESGPHSTDPAHRSYRRCRWGAARRRRLGCRRGARSP